MRCLYCGKPLGFLRELTDSEFCCNQHRERYAKLTKAALARLLPQEEQHSAHATLDNTPGFARAVNPVQTSAPLGAAGSLHPLRDMAHVELPALRALSAPATCMGSFSRLLSPVIAPVPFRTVLSVGSMAGNPLMPVPPKSAALLIKHGIRCGISLKAGPVVSGLVRALRGVKVLTMPMGKPVGALEMFCQPRQPSYASKQCRPESILNFSLAPALPAGFFAAPRLLPPQPKWSSLLIAPEAAKQRLPALWNVATKPVSFRSQARWLLARTFNLSILGCGLFTEQARESRQPCIEYLPVGPHPGAAASGAATSAMPILPVFPAKTLQDGFSSTILGRVPLPVSFSFGLAPPHPVALRATIQAGAAPLVSSAQPKLPELIGDMRGSLREASVAHIMARQVTRQPQFRHEVQPLVNIARGALRLPTSGLESFSEPDVALAMTGFKAEPCKLATTPTPAGDRLFYPPAVLRRLHLPKLHPLEGTQSLRQNRTIAMPLGLADVPVMPPHPVEPASLEPSTGLPVLATLFRHSWFAKSQRTSPIVFDFGGVTPSTVSSLPLAYKEFPLESRPPIVPKSSVLRIVETFQYLRPLEQGEFSLLQPLRDLWERTPALAKVVAAAACLLACLWVLAPDAPMGAAVENRWEAAQQAIRARAAVELTDDFHDGFAQWLGEGDWNKSWSFVRAGFVRPGHLALYRPSLRMRNYRLEFLAQIEKKSVSWVYRASDHANYYASKITVVKPGPLPSVALIRYPVIGGKAGPRVEVPIRVLMHNDTPYRVQLTVTDKDFTTSIEGQLVDYWRDDRLKIGGVGFFSDRGERARIYWVKLSHQDDFIGKVCAYFYPSSYKGTKGN